MNNFGKVLIKMGLLSLFSVMPLMAQIGDNGVYKVVQPDADADILLIENRGDLRSVFVDFEPTESTFPHRNSAVTFDKYGDTNYLDRVWLDGQEYGIKVDPGRVETAAEANATQHATPVGGQ
jgi:hypothetical protein